MSGIVVETRDLTVRLGAEIVLEDVTVTVPEAGVLVVIGPNGSGKTTFVRALLGLVRPERGDVRVFGLAPSAVAPERLGYVPQIKTFDRSFPGTGAELVVSGLRRRWPWRITREERERARAALALLGSERLAGRTIAQLSGGELQRLYLARALVRRAALIVLDEPATGVDIAGEETLHGFIDTHRRAADVTSVIVTHDMSLAADHATHVLLINRRQIAFGPPAAVLTDAALTRAFGHVGHPYAVRVAERPHA
jgi:zinc transport system ATP-binding protein